MLKMGLRTLTTPNDLDAAIAASADRPLLLFKHSLTCGTSAFALEQIEEFLSEPAWPVDASVVHVPTGRALSNAIAEHFGIRHETPQALLIRNGQIVWHASHYRITRREMTAALERCHASAVSDSTTAGIS